MTYEEARNEICFTIKQVSDGYYIALAHGGKTDERTENYLNALDYAKKALEKQMPKKPKHIHEEYHEHLWKRTNNGEIDMWAMEYEYHNGPRCERCGESFCVHCNSDWEEDKNCVVDKLLCPNCGEKLSRWKKAKYCDGCGQAIDWSDAE